MPVTRGDCSNAATPAEEQEKKEHRTQKSNTAARRTEIYTIRSSERMQVSKNSRAEAAAGNKANLPAKPIDTHASSGIPTFAGTSSAQLDRVSAIHRKL